MKYCFLILIVVLFGAIGYYSKFKLINQKRIIAAIKNYVEFYDSNITIFKVNLIDINNKYIIMQNNKNAKINIFKTNSANICEFNINLIKNSLYNIQEIEVIERYFLQIGTGNYEYEKNKNKQLLEFLNKLKVAVDSDIKTKGELKFKILLAVGAVIAILLWWIMEVSVLFKIGAIGILTIVISQLFQHQGKSDMSTLISLAGFVIILAMVLSMVSDLFSTIKTLFELY